MNITIEYISTLSGLITTLLLFSVVFIVYEAMQYRAYKKELEEEGDENG